MTAFATCGLRLYDVLLAQPDAVQRVAAARMDVWKRYRVQLPRVVCVRHAGHEGKCVWGSFAIPAMSWWRLGVDPTTPDPETDAMIGRRLRSAVAPDLMRIVGALSSKGRMP